MKPLSKDTVSAPITKRPIKVLQFGGGNFLRGFTDWMIDILNEETDFNGNVLLVKPTPEGDYSSLRKQDGLYHVVLSGLSNDKPTENIRLISCISEVIHPYLHWSLYLASSENPNIRFIISNTTEAGIFYNSEDTLDWNVCPENFPAKLTLWLYRRYQFFNASTEKGCIMLPLELIKENGRILKDAVLNYAGHFQFEESFSIWIRHHNYFCDTLVDRIVSGYPKNDYERIFDTIGFEDQQLVCGETYHSWIIKGPPFIKDEIPFSRTNLNVQFAEDLEIHQKIKVRILNGAHIAMVPIGLLSGHRLVSEAMGDGSIFHFIKNMLEEEVRPTIDFPADRLQQFIDSVFLRFKNPAIKHQLGSIALNATTKYIERLHFTLLDFYNNNGELPRHIVFALAALIRMYHEGVKSNSIDLNDKSEILELFRIHSEKSEKMQQNYIHGILGETAIWGRDLNEVPQLSSLTQEFYNIQVSNGMHYALTNINNESF